MCATIGCVPHTLLMRDEHAVFFIKHGKQKFIFNSEFFRVIQSLSQKKKKTVENLQRMGWQEFGWSTLFYLWCKLVVRSDFFSSSACLFCINFYKLNQLLTLVDCWHFSSVETKTRYFNDNNNRLLCTDGISPQIIWVKETKSLVGAGCVNLFITVRLLQKDSYVGRNVAEEGKRQEEDSACACGARYWKMITKQASIIQQGNQGGHNLLIYTSCVNQICRFWSL